MRVLHVVTLLSPDGAYGGPVRVACNQAEELRRRGHQIVLTAAVSGADAEPAGLDVRGFPATTAIPKVGFAGLRARGMTRWLRRHVREFDVVHVHLARDLVTLPAARIVRSAGVPLIVQTHGMIDPSDRLLARPLDRFWTVPILRSAAAVLHLTPREATDLAAVAGPGAELPLRELHNGVPLPAADSPGAGPDGTPEVLYLARMHPRKRPELFVRLAARLHAEGVAARFAMVGPDEGAADPTRQLIDSLAAPVRWEGPLPPQHTAERMARASVYVLASVDEPYPMSVLEAMARGLPVVVTDSCGLAPLIRENACGIVVRSDDLDSLTAAVRELLLQPHIRAEMGAAAARLVRDRLSMNGVAERLEQIYREAHGVVPAGELGVRL
ncbi:MAG: glycosyltransferase [Nocardia sp.]|uniref:glycosyltransferase n=1 Tax=Nocardia sp. TaxID=1821 RepID=UPI0026046101|nr:glycosyltransferase [Nocardia sp.]MCU1648150.1 glycosyltransferase [Nocardia sp.]